MFLIQRVISRGAGRYHKFIFYNIYSDIPTGHYLLSDAVGSNASKTEDVMEQVDGLHPDIYLIVRSRRRYGGGRFKAT